jgi:hypothetical protein
VSGQQHASILKIEHLKLLASLVNETVKRVSKSGDNGTEAGLLATFKHASEAFVFAYHFLCFVCFLSLKYTTILKIIMSRRIDHPSSCSSIYRIQQNVFLPLYLNTEEDKFFETR